MLRLVRLKKYDGYGSPVNMNFIWEQLKLVENNYDVQLFEHDRIIKLDVPFSEVYHKCSDAEWEELLKYVEHFLG